VESADPGATHTRTGVAPLGEQYALRAQHAELFAAGLNPGARPSHLFPTGARAPQRAGRNPALRSGTSSIDPIRPSPAGGAHSTVVTAFRRKL